METFEQVKESRDQLRAEVARLSEWQAGVIKNARAHHAQLKEATARAERAEAELAAAKLLLNEETDCAEAVEAAIVRQYARAERAEAELAAERARRDDLIADLNDACITLASACDDCDDYALLNTRCKLTAVRDVLIQYIPPAEMKEGK
jgi:chromosome segregation ATPase